LINVGADARLDPHAVLIDQTDASHRYMEDNRRHLGDAVEGKFRRSVENPISAERVKALRFVFGEHRFHLP
jgi:hypothetical protein